MGRLGSSGSAALDFTDGDTLKRFTVVDPIVQSSSRISGTVQRASIADLADPGWIFVPNIVSVADGTFDVLVAALSGDAIAGPGEFPNEVATLTYLVD